MFQALRVCRILMVSIVVLISYVPVVQADVININNSELKMLLERGVPIIDVRRSEEWQATGTIVDSHLLTFFDAEGRYDAESWQLKLNEIASADEPFILICRTGRRTSLISKWLSEKQGYSQVYNVVEGIVGWSRESGTTVPYNESILPESR